MKQQFRQFFGSPIQCDAGSAKDGIEKEVLESYCWMYSTWNIPREYKGACSGGDQDMDTTTIGQSTFHPTSIHILTIARNFQSFK